MSEASFVTRFAPSPTGMLHLGHAYSALVAYRMAQQVGGRFILRIEDIDQTRCKPAFEEAIFDHLAWLGLEWEIPVRRQSDHFEAYHNALDGLRQRGLIYRCFKTRKDVAEDIARAPHGVPNGPEGPAYVGKALAPDKERALLAKGTPFAWRLSLTAARAYLKASYDDLFFCEQDLEGGAMQRKSARPDQFGDVILGRKDAGTSYHLASVHDDALQGVTHVIRGNDLKDTPHLHALLQALLGAPQPVYRHHRLMTDEHGKRLAKRDRAMTLQQLRLEGVTPADIIQRLGL